MREGYNDLDDKELEALIADVEKNGMIAPPVYLKELIMKAAAEEEQAAKGTGRSMAVGNRDIVIQNKEYMLRKAKIQFLAYSFKIAAAAAVAVFCLTAIPMDIAGGALEKGDYMEERIERDIERYQQEKEKALADEEGGGLESFLGRWLKSRSDIDVDGIWNNFIN